MDEIAHLKSLWTPRPHTSTELITDTRDSWVYSVPSAFNDALDIKYEEKRTNKKSYMIWTRGPYLSFKGGDVIHSRDGRSCLQVNDAKPMKWDDLKSEMDEGAVNYSEYEIVEGKYLKSGSCSKSQMGFLVVLIGLSQNED